MQNGGAENEAFPAAKESRAADSPQSPMQSSRRLQARSLEGSVAAFSCPCLLAERTCSDCVVV